MNLKNLFLIDATIIGNGVAMIIRLVQSSVNRIEAAHHFAADWDTLVFGGRKLFHRKIRL